MGKAFATHDRQDTHFNIRGFAALSGTFAGREAILLHSRLECFSFLLPHLSRRVMAGSVRTKPFPDEWPSALKGCYRRPPAKAGAYPYTHLPRTWYQQVSTIRY